MELTSADKTRFQRHLNLAQVGTAGQAKLKASRIALVGIGGLGSPSALYLAAAGVGTMGLIDHDQVDLSNLQRQLLYDENDVAQDKIKAAARRLQAINSSLNVQCHAQGLNAENAMDILANYDVVLDGTDRLATRYLVNDACVLLGKPLISAAIHSFEGQLMLCQPGQSACYRCLFPETSEAEPPNCAETGVLGVLPGVLGTLQAVEAVKLILGLGRSLAGRLLTYDALEQRFDEFKISRRPECPVCGDHPSISKPQLIQPDNTNAVVSISAQALLQKLKTGVDQALIDVREPAEYASGHIQGSINIPLIQLANALPELSADTVFICASGQRSISACAQAQKAGLSSCTSLAGGISAWPAGLIVSKPATTS